MQGLANILPAATAEPQGGLVTRAQPSLRDLIPSLQVPSGTVRAGLGQAPQNLNMMNMPAGGGMITRQNPDGSIDHYWANPAGQTGHDLADLVPSPSRMDTGMMDNAQDAPGLRDVARSIRAKAGQTPTAGINPGVMPLKNMSLSDFARLKRRKKPKKRFNPGQTGVEMKTFRERPGRLSQHVPGGLWG